ncbi:MAG: phosphate/phosphite/phosphonate ABC transporter substrate-binding protein [Actinomycetota bacterium]|nr:phosphate/phosphite/phosphonate ABC transporter substrate-binding protein [Actinomycetota bacterium]
MTAIFDDRRGAGGRFSLLRRLRGGGPAALGLAALLARSPIRWCERRGRGSTPSHGERRTERRVSGFRTRRFRKMNDLPERGERVGAAAAAAHLSGTFPASKPTGGGHLMRSRALGAALCALVFVAAACGDDDDDTETSDTTEASEDTSETTEATDDTAEEGAAEGEVPEDWPEELVFTLTPSQETGGLIETAQPLADMLAEELGVDVSASVPTDYAGVIAALASDRAQIAGGLGPRQMVQAEEQADAELILQSERFGSLLYVTQWFTNDPDTYCTDEPVADEDGFLFCNGVLDAESAADGPIGADQLPLVEGQTIAFVDQGSTSGYAIPALQLSEAGVDPIDGIDALFAGGHDSAVQAVYDGDAAVGVSFNDARGEIIETTPDVGEQVVVFGWSGPIPNDGFAVSSALPDDLVEAITEAFVTISGTDEGAEVLSELYSIDALVPVTSSDYDVIRDLETELGDVLS